jgi:hypothetical protein
MQLMLYSNQVNPMRLKLLPILIGFGLSSFACMAVGGNPATTDYVRRVVEDGIVRATYTAGSGIRILNKEISILPSLSIGDLYQGGIVFYLDDTGRHGLLIALNDAESPGAAHHYSTNTTVVNAFSSGVGAGVINTANVLATLTAAGQATVESANAFISVNKTAVEANGITRCETGIRSTLLPPLPSSSCFGGWYLGSAYELQLIHLNFERINRAIAAAGGTEITVSENYWSSTMQFGTDNAYSIHLSTGVGTAVLMTNSDSARGIRQF